MPAALGQGIAQQATARQAPAPASWTIAVVTSTADPASKRLLESLRSNVWVVANADRVKLAEVSSEAMGRPASAGSTAVLLYQPGPRGPEMVGGRSGFAGADDVVLWVRKMIAASAETSIRDPNLAQANLFDKSLPSGQSEASTPYYQTPQPQLMLPQTPSYPQNYLTQPQTMTYGLPMAGPATMVQAPQQHLVIQQPPTQVMFAQQPSPMVYPMQVAAPGPNLFMGPMVAPQPQPVMVAPQPQPMALAPQPAGLPVGPSVAGASLTTSSFSVPASSTTSRIRVRGPGPVASALARFGERLTTLGRTRIESVQETRLETQVAQTPPGQFLTLSSTSASPVLAPAQPQNILISQPQQPAPPPLPPTTTPQCPQPSPQSGSWRSR